ncbi:hypothetical protein BGZ97_007936 [Linnemannia gamsii]|uniref:Uncharacterized protein n=1 Tax=Linnemannia gamsii TaxID=64522 RepID=A0A9P6RC36_9FUNG|nr:hypothetical protein BGZ97_007936 [Linnemannia gamsii]
MALCQRFRQGNKVELLAVRKDKTTGVLYIRKKDVQRVFPGTCLFKVDGVVLYYLEDENEKEYEPKRIAHYPDDTIDVVVAKLEQAPSPPPVSRPSKTMSPTRSGKSCHQRPSLSSEGIDISVSNLSLQPRPAANSRAFVRAPLQATTFSPVPSNLIALQAAPITRSMAMLSRMAGDITQLQQQLERSSDQLSVNHQQQMQQLIEMVAQQNEMVQQQNELVRMQNVMLQEQAGSRAREERIIQEQAESKVREEQMLSMQQETIDRLIVSQQRVDVILVQNYELHEYPIPRLFVVLPDSFGEWDPRNVLMERFRLHFLCECDDVCESGEGPPNPIPVKNSIHLAKHDGYELSRPTEFFEQYGPYVLGMLRILQHCLAVAAVVAPVVALADSGLGEIMDGVKSISESTIEAVDMSINILENKLSDNDIADDLSGPTSCKQESDTMLENLAALEGADLRRLATFLRNNDQDKILGNLYRITNDKGHVKWVCFEHYQEKYRATALTSFTQVVETAGGTYDPQLGQDFFRRLASQAPAVQTLDVTLDWDFGSGDLVTLVDMVAKSNVKVVKLDLQDDHTSNATIASLRPGKGRYHSLLNLLFNTKLRSLQISNLYLLGTRTIKLEWRLYQEIKSLRKLRRLHLVGWYQRWIYSENDGEDFLKDLGPMTEIVYPNAPHDTQSLTKIIRRSGKVLNVLVLFSDSKTSIEIGSEDPLWSLNFLAFAERPSKSLATRRSIHLCALTHLDLQVPLNDESIQYLSNVLPYLDLIHFGCDPDTLVLFKYCNYNSLKSLSICSTINADLQPFLDATADETTGRSCAGLEQLSFTGWWSNNDIPTQFLQCVQLTRLFLSNLSSTALDESERQGHDLLYYLEPIQAMTAKVPICHLTPTSVSLPASTTIHTRRS